MIPANPGYSANDYRNLVSRLLVMQTQAAGAMSGRPGGHGVGPMAGAVAPTGDLPVDLTLPRQPTPAAAGTPPVAPAMKSPNELMGIPAGDATEPPVRPMTPTAPPPAAPAAPAFAGFGGFSGAEPAAPPVEQPVDGSGAAGATVGFSGGNMAGDQSGSSGSGGAGGGSK